MRSLVAFACCALFTAGCALPSRETSPADGLPVLYASTAASTATVSVAAYTLPAAPDHDAGHVLLWYIPNRISDLLDIVRARLRLGPGLAVGARFTNEAIFHAGGYSSIFVGIPGPRLEREFNWPFGVETVRGGGWSPFDGTAWSGDDPTYGKLEIGLGTQLLIVGADLGVDVYEALDFITGIITIDPIGDDI